MTTYELDAKTALAKVGGSIKINLSDTKISPWDNDGQYRPHYRVTLRGPGGSYTFDFWGSINMGQTGEAATPYDVLTCLEWYTPENYSEFCSEFGYDEDSRKAHKTWAACLAQRRALERIFPSESARQALSEIR